MSASSLFSGQDCPLRLCSGRRILAANRMPLKDFRYELKPCLNVRSPSLQVGEIKNLFQIQVEFESLYANRREEKKQ